jgi:hypothetical protein
VLEYKAIRQLLESVSNRSRIGLESVSTSRLSLVHGTPYFTLLIYPFTYIATLLSFSENRQTYEYELN